MNKPKVVLIVDCSSSMSGEIQKINAHVNELSGLFDTAEIAIAPFASHPHKIVWNHEIQPLRAGGSTALYKSIIATLTDLQAKFTSRDKVLIITITDGEDCVGGAFPADVAREVQYCEKILSWDFLYVGTNQNAYEVGAEMGVQLSKSLSFGATPEGFAEMLNSLRQIEAEWIAGRLGNNDDYFVEARDIQSRLGALQFTS